jgi:glycerophosphoryl diester phosphodiesterase
MRRHPIIALVLTVLGGAQRLTPAELPALKHSFVVIAHRGEHQRHLENTLEAIDGAIEAGADFVELDVRRSRDGHYLLMHDVTVDRMTDGKGTVAELEWMALKNLKVINHERPELPSSRIPSFEEALERCHNRIHIYLDFKEGDRQEVTGLIHRAGMDHQVLVYDGVEAIAEWRAVAPEFPLIVSPPDAAAASPDALKEFLKRHPVEVLDDDWSGWTTETVRTAETAGSRVWPDIQQREESSAHWTKVLEVGFKGVQTDHPRELIAWLKARNRR